MLVWHFSQRRFCSTIIVIVLPHFIQNFAFLTLSFHRCQTASQNFVLHDSLSTGNMERLASTNKCLYAILIFSTVLFSLLSDATFIVVVIKMLLWNCNFQSFWLNTKNMEKKGLPKLRVNHRLDYLWCSGVVCVSNFKRNDVLITSSKEKHNVMM